MKSRRALLQVVLVLVFVSVCTVIFLQSRSAKKKLGGYNPALANATWKQYTYTPISNAPAFREKVDAAIAQALAPDFDADKKLALANLAKNLLAAYSDGSFDTFWAFRVPNGRHLPGTTRDRDSVWKVAERVEKRIGNDPAKIPFQPQHRGTNTDIKAATARVWALAEPYEQLKKAHPEDKSLISLCTTCFQAVALDKVKVTVFPRQKTTPAVDEIAKEDLNIGVMTMFGTIEQTPSESEIASANDGKVDYACVEVCLQLANGVLVPCRVLAYWDQVGKSYVPLKLFYSRAGSSTPRTLF